jgi:hypothetical protein
MCIADRSPAASRVEPCHAQLDIVSAHCHPFYDHCLVDFWTNNHRRHVTAGQFRDIQQKMTAMAIQSNSAFTPAIPTAAQAW